jgi:drug/metabolite transporter (DMT)-like permease
VNKLKGFFSLLLGAIIFGSFGIWIRFMSQDFAVYQQIAAKNILAFCFAVMLSLALKQKFPKKFTHKKYIFSYVISFIVSVVAFTFSILETKIGTAIFALYAGSLLSSILGGHFLFQERLDQIKILSLLLVVIGLCTYVYPISPHSLNLGFILGIVSGIADTVTHISRRHLKEKIDRFVLFSIQMFCGSCVALVLMAVSGQLYLPHISFASGIGSLLMGILTVTVAYFVLIGFQNFDLNLGTVVLSGELFFGSLFAFLIFGEAPSLPEFVGSCFIMAAIVVMNCNLENFKHRKKLLE